VNVFFVNPACLRACVRFVDLFSSFAFCFRLFVCVVCGGRKVNFVAAFFLLSAAFVDFCRRRWISSSWLYDAVAGGCECGERERERKKRLVVSWWWCNVAVEAPGTCAVFSLFSAALQAKKVLVGTRMMCLFMFSSPVFL
jgi:hypothetical protein